jgi:methylmalonyl-CoA/ethylmalonyl-CoA epimerase
MTNAETALPGIPTPPTPFTITQIAIVVRDIEKAMHDYTHTLGWGPWSVFDYKPPLLHDTIVRGERVEFRMIGAETMVNGLGFELIQPVSGPSIYQEHLDQHGEGVQHIACMKHSDQDSDVLKQHLSEHGSQVIMSGRIGESIEFYYIDTAPALKFVLESGNGHAIDLAPSYTYPASA